MNLLRNIQIVASTKTAICPAGTTMYGPPVDMSDCDGVLFIVAGSSEFASKGSGKGHLSVQMASSTGVAVGSWSHYGSTRALSAISNTTKDCRIAALDFYRPQITVPGSGIHRKYARAALENCTQLASFICIKYGLRNPGATGWYSSSVKTEFATIVGATKNT